jgi:hypothetical protein
MFSKAFWRATAERAISTGAQSALLIIGADQVNVIDGVDWLTVGGFAAGGAALTVLKALAFGSRDGNPSATNAEKIVTQK